MIDEKRLKTMKRKPSLGEITKPNMSENAKVVFRVSMARAKKDQAKLLKKAASLQCNIIVEGKTCSGYMRDTALFFML